MLGDMTQIDRQFAIIEARFSFRTMGKVVTQIVEGNIRDKLPFFPRRGLLHRFEPLMDRSLTQPPPIQVAFCYRKRFALRGKDIRTAANPFRFFQILVERSTSVIEQEDVPILALLMPDGELAHFRANLGMRLHEIGHITDTTPGPIPKREDGWPSQIACLLLSFDEVPQHEPLLL